MTNMTFVQSEAQIHERHVEIFVGDILGRMGAFGLPVPLRVSIWGFPKIGDPNIGV